MQVFIWVIRPVTGKISTYDRYVCIYMWKCVFLRLYAYILYIICMYIYIHVDIYTCNFTSIRVHLSMNMKLYPFYRDIWLQKLQNKNIGNNQFKRLFKFIQISIVYVHIYIYIYIYIYTSLSYEMIHYEINFDEMERDLYCRVPSRMVGRNKPIVLLLWSTNKTIVSYHFIKMYYVNSQIVGIEDCNSFKTQISEIIIP
jgi:hypothetical protein